MPRYISMEICRRRCTATSETHRRRHTTASSPWRCVAASSPQTCTDMPQQTYRRKYIAASSPRRCAAACTAASSPRRYCMRRHLLRGDDGATHLRGEIPQAICHRRYRGIVSAEMYGGIVSAEDIAGDMPPKIYRGTSPAVHLRPYISAETYNTAASSPRRCTVASVDGLLAQGDVSCLEATYLEPRGVVPRGDAPRGDVPRGDVPRGVVPRGDVPRSSRRLIMSFVVSRSRSLRDSVHT